MMNSFWWGSKRSGGSGGINWMKWERLCKPKDFGGIAKDIVVKGSRIQIGSGQQVLIGNDPWLPNSECGFITTELHEEIKMAPVCNLMVPDQRRWDYDAVTDLFNPRDRDLILQIPLSTRRDLDLWLDVPGKVKNLLWRAANNVLPTTDNLRNRKIQVLPLCSVCNAYNESVIHILVDCGFAKSCWIASPVGYIGQTSSFLEWLGLIFSRCSKEDCDLAAMICWKIWAHRNDKVWNNRSGRVYQILNSAGHLLYQWQSLRKQAMFTDVDESSSVHGAVCWKRPHVGWVKCNVDAAVFSSQAMVGLGCVVRNSEGIFLTAKCDRFLGSFGAREAEAFGVREALSWLKKLQFPRVIIEIDCLQVFKALTENHSSPNGFGLIIEECRFLA
ncbi:rnase h domain-containing protein [Citrus sinensis]|uniref:Rnase h domain-containing protein n=1 Tax=Citrus sinensis TaxID=2711 RepID=A0ACB8HWM7_CITSI|nr:rnase h domain-containing protein [Citrus sinensis]